ncbi:glycoside hydrolase family 43 C-terminal domain-containing protein [Streptomyces sp. SS]|uniref:glycoside hydrolase family 43 C-terminal domain-containing protein n=1 Tax=Streptomyces sp. SS TaxID=260742 RepID=UPI001ED9A1F2|nr:glycoside hydrolase family 43 C-terminal domain-containing protein [Streptomyces sp. SS]
MKTTRGNAPRALTRYGMAVALLATLTACLAGPGQYYEGTDVHDATSAEVAGAWESVEGTAMTLRPDGTATVTRLDGEDFDFDEGWRLSGTGTWSLSDDANGQDVRLELTTRTKVDKRDDATTPPPDGGEAPTTYSWRFYVDRNDRRELVLFFFFGDPDAGSTYVLTRKPSATAAP